MTLRLFSVLWSQRAEAASGAERKTPPPASSQDYDAALEAAAQTGGLPLQLPVAGWQCERKCKLLTGSSLTAMFNYLNAMTQRQRQLTDVGFPVVQRARQQEGGRGSRGSRGSRRSSRGGRGRGASRGSVMRRNRGRGRRRGSGGGETIRAWSSWAPATRPPFPPATPGWSACQGPQPGLSAQAAGGGRHGHRAPVSAPAGCAGRALCRPR